MYLPENLYRDLCAAVESRGAASSAELLAALAAELETLRPPRGSEELELGGQQVLRGVCGLLRGETQASPPPEAQIPLAPTLTVEDAASPAEDILPLGDWPAPLPSVGAPAQMGAPLRFELAPCAECAALVLRGDARHLAWHDWLRRQG